MNCPTCGEELQLNPYLPSELYCPTGCGFTTRKPMTNWIKAGIGVCYFRLGRIRGRKCGIEVCKHDFREHGGVDSYQITTPLGITLEVFPWWRNCWSLKIGRWRIK